MFVYWIWSSPWFTTVLYYYETLTQNSSAVAVLFSLIQQILMNQSRIQLFTLVWQRMPIEKVWNHRNSLFQCKLDDTEGYWGLGKTSSLRLFSVHSWVSWVSFVFFCCPASSPSASAFYFLLGAGLWELGELQSQWCAGGVWCSVCGPSAEHSEQWREVRLSWNAGFYAMSRLPLMQTRKCVNTW